MDSIEEQALRTYDNNLNYLLHFHPDLHKKMQTFDAAVQMGQLAEKYELEYINGYFDVKEIATQTYLYKENNVSLAKSIAKQVNFKKDEQTFQTLYNYVFDDAAIEVLNEGKIQDNFYKGTAELIHYLNTNHDQKAPMKEIYKYVFLGVGLGLHLTEVDNKVKASHYLIVEDDIELFKLSLFVTDYAKLSIDSTLHFSIFETGSAFNKSVNDFLLVSSMYNNYIKFFPFSNAYEYKIKMIQSAIVSQSYRVYTFDRLIQKSLVSLSNLNEHYNHLNISSAYKDTVFSKNPILYLAAGPSLGKNRQWLKENHQNYIIITPSVVLPLLEKLNISPDIVLHIDEFGTTVERIVDQMTSLEFLKNTRFIFAASAPKQLLNVFPKSSIYLIQDLSAYKKGFGALQGNSVGEIGYALTLLFGAHEIYLLGLDLALDPETGSTHTPEHLIPEVKDMKNIDTADDIASLRESTFKIPGNFEETVPTTPLFYMSIHFVNSYSKTLKTREQNVYNLSNGAAFEGVPALKVGNIPINSAQRLERVEITKSIKKFLDENSSNSIRKEDLDAIQTRVDQAFSIKDAIIAHSQHSYPNYDIFITAYINLLTHLIPQNPQERRELAQILFFYTQSISGYITDFFNTRNLSNTKRHIKKIDKILVIKLLEIIDVYLDMLEKVRKE